jgi:hypothetical protein
MLETEFPAWPGCFGFLYLLIVRAAIFEYFAAMKVECQV